MAALGYVAVQHLVRLAPFGQGNEPPVVAIRGCKLIGPPRRMGRNGQAVSLTLSQDGTTIRAVGFSMGDLPDHLVGVNTVDVAGEPSLNTYNGRTNLHAVCFGIEQAKRHIRRPIERLTRLLELPLIGEHRADRFGDGDRAYHEHHHKRRHQ